MRREIVRRRADANERALRVARSLRGPATAIGSSAGWLSWRSSSSAWRTIRRPLAEAELRGVRLSALSVAAIARDRDDRLCGYMVCMTPATAPGSHSRTR